VPSVVSENVRQTVRLLVERSPVVAQAVAAGRCAVVGLVYGLVEGRVRMVDVVGDVGEHASPVHDVSHG
jgi:carbonic anhydrase